MSYNNRGSRPRSTGSYNGRRTSSSKFTNSNRGRGGRNRGGVAIDVSKFINKAVVVDKEDVFVPIHTFADPAKSQGDHGAGFNLEPLLVANILAKGYVTPTPIQDEAIPHALLGKDVVGIANTGTGKTAAFLIPLINKILKEGRGQVLVVAPTRELALQIDEELRDFAKKSGLFSVLCIGGVGIGKQIRELRSRHQFVIGTPGRLKDLVEQKVLNLSGFNHVVLDEADRMLDMGFITDIRFLLAKTPKDRHTLFFSATLSSEIERLIHEFLREPVRVSVKSRDTAKNVHQDIVRIPAGKSKFVVLHELLAQAEFSKVLVFGRTKHGVERLARELGKQGFKTESIHGNKSQVQRQRALDKFKSDNAQVLTATDVAARGLDISDITHVINFDVPATYEDYVHRIGRTGRGDKSGKALTFID